jgi:hypothetical protein
MLTLIEEFNGPSLAMFSSYYAWLIWKIDLKRKKKPESSRETDFQFKWRQVVIGAFTRTLASQSATVHWHKMFPILTSWKRCSVCRMLVFIDPMKHFEKEHWKSNYIYFFSILCMWLQFSIQISFNFPYNTLFYWLKNWGDFVSPEKKKNYLWRKSSNNTE